MKMTKRMRDIGIQVLDYENIIKVDKSTNTEGTYDNQSDHSYDRYKKVRQMNYRTLINSIIATKESTINWCKEGQKVRRSECQMVGEVRR